MRGVAIPQESAEGILSGIRRGCDAFRFRKILMEEDSLWFENGSSVADMLEGKADVMRWVESNRVIKGRPFRYDDARGAGMMLGDRDAVLTTAPRPYLQKMLRDQGKDKTVIKARQVEASEHEINENLFLAVTRPHTMVRHVFPTAGIGNQMAKERIHSAVTESPKIYQQLVKPIAMGSHGFRNGSWYTVTSSWTETGGRGPSSDKITFDEYESQNPKIEEIFSESTAHSTLARRTRISTPVFPMGGIDGRYEDSSANEWWVVCPKCHRRQQMTFPDSLIGYFDRPSVIEHEGEYHERLKKIYIGCKYCKEYIDRTSKFYLAHSNWFPKRPSLEGFRTGYRVTGFMVPWRTGYEIAYKAHTFKFLNQFYNEVLGYAFRGESTDLTETMVRACCDPGLQMTVRRIGGMKNVSVGIDWGPDTSWLVCVADGLPRFPKTPAVFYLERIDKVSLRNAGYSGDDLDHARRAAEIIDAVNATIIINDANGVGNDRNSYLIRRYKGRAWGCFYDTQDNQRQRRRTKQIEPTWSEMQSRVTVSRTVTLKSMMEVWRSRLWVLPQYTPEVQQLVMHLCNLAVSRQEDEDGNEYEIVGSVGPDHYAHAINYAKIGFDRVSGRESGNLIPGVM